MKSTHSTQPWTSNHESVLFNSNIHDHDLMANAKWRITSILSRRQKGYST